jgi:hypothetical protein
MRKKDKILIIAATHGNEPVGVDIMRYLRGTLGLDMARTNFIIGNPRAYAEKRRFLDADLNRAYPGDKRSGKYEDRRAAELYALAQGYKCVIDIHQMAYGRENLIIVPKRLVSDRDLINKVKINKIILWPSTSGRKTGPMAQFISNGLELEIATGAQPYGSVVKNASNLIFDFIENIDQRTDRNRRPDQFLVYGKLLTGELSESRDLEDLKKTRINKETFYPLLVNQYLSEGIICYKTKKIVP